MWEQTCWQQTIVVVAYFAYAASMFTIPNKKTSKGPDLAETNVIFPPRWTRAANISWKNITWYELCTNSQNLPKKTTHMLLFPFLLLPRHLPRSHQGATIATHLTTMTGLGGARLELKKWWSMMNDLCCAGQDLKSQVATSGIGRDEAWCTQFWSLGPVVLRYATSSVQKHLGGSDFSEEIHGSTINAMAPQDLPKKVVGHQ